MTLIINILAMALCVALAVMLPWTAVLLSLVLSAACCFIASYAGPVGDEWAMAVGLFIFPVALLTAFVSHWWKKFTGVGLLIIIAKTILYLLAGTILLVGLIYVFNFFGILIFGVFISTLIGYAVTSRFSTVLDVISTIRTSMEQNLPLATALDTAAGQNQDRRSEILRNISAHLTQGCRLSEAIKAAWPRCPAYIVSAIEAAEKIDQLPKCIKSLEADVLNRIQHSGQVRPVHPAYPLMVLTIAFMILSGLLTFIIPVFAEVLFDVTEGQAVLPRATQILLNFANMLTSRHGLPMALIILAVITVCIIRLFIRFRPRRPANPHLISELSDFIKWHFPLTRWFEHNYSLLRAVELLKVALRAGVTVDTAIERTIELDTNCCFRRRLRRWLRKVQCGENVSTAADQCGLGRMLTWAFNEETAGKDTPAVLDMIENLLRNSYNYRANIVRSVVWPLVILALGLTVGFVVYAMFVPMVVLTNYMIAGTAP